MFGTSALISKTRIIHARPFYQKMPKLSISTGRIIQQVDVYLESPFVYAGLFPDEHQNGSSCTRGARGEVVRLKKIRKGTRRERSNQGKCAPSKSTCVYFHQESMTSISPQRGVVAVVIRGSSSRVVIVGHRSD